MGTRGGQGRNSPIPETAAESQDALFAALQESQARLELATNAAQLGIWDWDIASGRMDYSPRAKKICGFPPDLQVTYEDARRVTHPDDYPRTSAMARRALDPAIRESEPYQYRILRADGTIRWVQAFGEAVFAEADGETRAVRYVGTLQDITEQVRLEQAKRANQARLQLAVEAGRMAVWEIDFTTDEVTGSPELNRLLELPPGYKPTAEDIRRRYYPGERERMFALAREAYERGEHTLEAELRYLWPDGSVRWLWVRAEVAWNDAAQPVHALGVIMDITERKRAEMRQQALVELADRFRDLDAPADLAYAAAEVLGNALGVSRVGYGTVDPAAETITIERDWNAPGIRSLAGVLHFRDYGSYIEDLKRGDTVVFDDAETDPRTAARAEALKAISAQAVVNMPVSERGGFVGLLYLNHATARRWEADELALVREVAERTRAAVARREAETELVELNRTLERRIDEALAERELAEEALRQSQKMEAIGQLTGGVAHDFNNLLTPIVGSLDMLQRHGVGGEREQRFIAGALQAAERAKTLVQRLLAFARRQPLQAKPVDVHGLVEGIRGLVESTCSPRVALTVDVPADLPAVHADPNQLEMAILNLAVNARDAMPDGGALTIAGSEEVAADTDKRFVRLSIADTGSGMDEDTLARSIEPFFSTKGVGQGTGLGLSMVHGLLAQLGGELRLASTAGVGTTVEMWLPVAGAAAAQAEQPQDSEPASVAGTALLVDDEELIRLSTADMLGELGYAVIEAASGEEAMKLIEGGARFDLLVTDHLMPGLSGTELAEHVRARWPGMPILVISGYAEADGVASDLQRLTKPFRKTELAAKIAGLLPS